MCSLPSQSLPYDPGAHRDALGKRAPASIKTLVLSILRRAKILVGGTARELGFLISMGMRESL